MAELSISERAFLDHLFSPEGLRHPEVAKEMAGYDKNYSVTSLINKIRKEFISRCDDYLTMYSPQGIAGLLDIINNPMEPGAKVKLQAIVELLDRGGVTKKDKTEEQQSVQNFMFVLPAKQPIEE